MAFRDVDEQLCEQRLAFHHRSMHHRDILANLRAQLVETRDKGDTAVLVTGIATK
jgi:hypothetical protein